MYGWFFNQDLKNLANNKQTQIIKGDNTKITVIYVNLN